MFDTFETGNPDTQNALFQCKIGLPIVVAMQYGIEMAEHSIPENFLSLWSEEDRIRSWAIEKIAEHEYLPGHLRLIETYMDCVDMVRRLDLRPKRRNALASLYLRTFDNFGSALRETLSGKPRGCAMYLRDQLETYFLIDYLSSEDGRPEAWIDATPDEIRKNY